MDDFYIYRGRLPHWRESGMTYFVTWRLHPDQRPLLPVERDSIVATLIHFRDVRYILFCYVVMDDHVHVIVNPRAPFQLQNIVHSWKSFSARALQERGRRGAVWQKESYDRIVRDEAEFRETINYILLNPQRRWPDVDHYRWVGKGDDALA